ncbi:histidine phosphatase family protein [Neobacillus jeddahensis]|uniref:histidine phosphatase family protein n=1 Tax=Neobacillus jeddahensis TaxID=1461580 RepID=UPI00058CC8E7|nr:histidine phosphatase family protein [Neobacillus jeddahensis]
MDDRVVIALFRHRITEENKRKAYLGWNDSPICPESKEIVITKRYEYYFSSDLQRCIDTANQLFSNQSLHLLKEFREMNFGKWEGKTYDELKGDPHYRNWLLDPVNHCPPDGESFTQFTERVQAGWDTIADDGLTIGMNSCAVITHGGVIRFLLSRFAPEHKDFWSWQIDHDHGFELVFDREALRRGERCTLLLEVPLMANEHG